MRTGQKIKCVSPSIPSVRRRSSVRKRAAGYMDAPRRVQAISEPIVEMDETPLLGGLTPGRVVRVGDTVRRAAERRGRRRSSPCSSTWPARGSRRRGRWGWMKPAASGCPGCRARRRTPLAPCPAGGGRGEARRRLRPRLSRCGRGLHPPVPGCLAPRRPGSGARRGGAARRLRASQHGVVAGPAERADRLRASAAGPAAGGRRVLRRPGGLLQGRRSHPADGLRRTARPPGAAGGLRRGLGRTAGRAAGRARARRLGELARIERLGAAGLEPWATFLRVGLADVARAELRWLDANAGLLA